MNRVVLMGRLTRDPDVRYAQGDNPMCIARYTLAVDRRFARGNNGNDGNSADFIPCVVFGRSAEFAEKYLRKGTKIAVTGRIQTGSYTNREGVKVYTTEVVVEDQEFAESRNAAGGSQGGYNGGQGSYNGGQGSYNGGQGGYNGGQGSYGNGGQAGYNGGSQSAQGNAQAGSGAGADANVPGGAQDGSQDSLDGFMNIPEGIDEELPFA